MTTPTAARIASQSANIVAALDAAAAKLSDAMEQTPTALTCELLTAEATVKLFAKLLTPHAGQPTFTAAVLERIDRLGALDGAAKALKLASWELTTAIDIGAAFGPDGGFSELGEILLAMDTSIVALCKKFARKPAASHRRRIANRVLLAAA